MLCSDGPAASAASSALDPAAPVVVGPAASVAVNPAAAAEVLGAAATDSAAELCARAALMLSMRVSTILTAVCIGRQQAVERAPNDSELGCAVVSAKQVLERWVSHRISRTTAADQTHSNECAGPLVFYFGLLLSFAPPHTAPLAPLTAPSACKGEVVCLAWPTTAESKLFGKPRHYKNTSFQLATNSVHASVSSVFPT